MALCKSLLKEIDHIALNVKATNRPAISAYKALGFERTAAYREFTIQTK